MLCYRKLRWFRHLYNFIDKLLVNQWKEYTPFTATCHPQCSVLLYCTSHFFTLMPKWAWLQVHSLTGSQGCFLQSFDGYSKSAISIFKWSEQPNNNQRCQVDISLDLKEKQTTSERTRDCFTKRKIESS